MAVRACWARHGTRERAAAPGGGWGPTELDPGRAGPEQVNSGAPRLFRMAYEQGRAGLPCAPSSARHPLGARMSTATSPSSERQESAVPSSAHPPSAATERARQHLGPRADVLQPQPVLAHWSLSLYAQAGEAGGSFQPTYRAPRVPVPGTPARDPVRARAEAARRGPQSGPPILRRQRALASGDVDLRSTAVLLSAAVEAGRRGLLPRASRWPGWPAAAVPVGP